MALGPLRPVQVIMIKGHGVQGSEVQGYPRSQDLSPLTKDQGPVDLIGPMVLSPHILGT